MLSYLKRHHMGVIALFVALGGTSYAATQLPPNSVGTKQIRAGSITATKIANGAVTPAKLSKALNAPSHKTGPTSHASWRDPSIIATIASTGQKIVDQQITTVGANRPWVDTGLSIASGAALWVDTRSDGKWSGNPNYFPYSDANGLPVYPGQYRVDAKAAVLSLIGFIGSSPPTPQEVSVGLGTPSGGTGGITNPGFVEIGNTLRNFAPKTSGKIWLRNNDNTNYYSDTGKQTAKVIVATSSP